MRSVSAVSVSITKQFAKQELLKGVADVLIHCVRQCIKRDLQLHLGWSAEALTDTFCLTQRQKDDAMSSNALDKSVNRLLIGAPRRPVGNALMKKLSKMLGDLELVKEAHLPEVVELGGDRSAELTLLVVVSSDSAVIPVTGILEVRIENGLPANQQIALRVVTEDFPLLAVARSIQCVVGWRD